MGLMPEKPEAEKEYVVTGAMVHELLEASRIYTNEKMSGKFIGGSGARYKSAMQAILNSPYTGPEALEKELDELNRAVAKVTSSIKRIRSGLNVDSK